LKTDGLDLAGRELAEMVPGWAGSTSAQLNAKLIDFCMPARSQRMGVLDRSAVCAAQKLEFCTRKVGPLE